MTDDEIYQGALEGDDDALHELVRSTREHVERVCAFFLAEDEALPGAVVGAYSRALVALGKGQKPDLPVKSWLSILATQECFATMVRLRGEYDTQTRQLEDMAGKIPTLVEITNDPKERVNFMIRGDIEDIPENHRLVLAMSELEGVHFLELAKRLSCSWATALNRLMGARQALAKRVKENFGL
jgi:DNA-directed RNA polymerase specialized sigma24 family protein